MTYAKTTLLAILGSIVVVVSVIMLVDRGGGASDVPGGRAGHSGGMGGAVEGLSDPDLEGAASRSEFRSEGGGLGNEASPAVPAAVESPSLENETEMRQVWIGVVEGAADDLLSGTIDEEQLAGMALELLLHSDLSDSSPTEEGTVAWQLVDDESLGKASLHYHPDPAGKDGVFELRLSLASPPMVWSRDEVRSTDMRVMFAPGSDEGTDDTCRAVLQVGLESDLVQRESVASGAAFRRDAEGAVWQEMMSTRVDGGVRRELGPEQILPRTSETGQANRLAELLRTLETSSER